MESRTLSARFGFLLLLMILGIFSRLIIHWPNFTAVGAIALIGGAQLRPRALAPILTLSILVLSDLVLGFYQGFGVVYLSFLLIGIQGVFMNFHKKSSILAHSIGASVLFFLVTNFSVWMSSGMYALDFSGLILCYFNALPYLLNFALGTVVFGMGLHFIMSWADRKIFRLA